MICMRLQNAKEKIMTSTDSKSQSCKKYLSSIFLAPVKCFYLYHHRWIQSEHDKSHSAKYTSKERYKKTMHDYKSNHMETIYFKRQMSKQIVLSFRHIWRQILR